MAIKSSTRWQRVKEKFLAQFFKWNGILAILVLFGIFSLFLVEGIPALKTLGINAFLNSRWDPTSLEKESYGILALMVSTFMVSFGAMVIAIPIGIGTSAYLAEVASPRLRELLKPVIEILAGVPSVVIGFLGILVVGPAIAQLFHVSHGLTALNGAILLAVMALPTIICISEDAISAVPHEFKQGSLALGATRWQTLTQVTLPAASSGIFASVMLGMGRAIGETMTVLMACGNAPAMPRSYLDSIQTMTATIAIELGETVQGGLHYRTLFVIGLLLFVMTFVFNLISDLVLEKYQKMWQR